MRKLSTMLALGLAMVMTLGMTVSAAGSPVAGSNSTTEAYGEKITEASANIEGVSVDANNAITIVSFEAGVAVAKDSFDNFREVVAAADVQVTGANGQEVTVTLSVAGVESGKLYKAIHEYEPGKYEILDVVVLADGQISITSDKWSPIILVLVDEDEDDSDDGDNGSNSVAASTDGSVVSPKTGEVMPIAGVMAIICMAGVVVCAKKARD